MPAVCQYAGKGQGEVSLLRRLWGSLRPGDILLTDALLPNWANFVMLKERGGKGRYYTRSQCQRPRCPPIHRNRPGGGIGRQVRARGETQRGGAASGG